MAKFHINQKDGTVGACRAEQGKCPFGGDEDHYTSIVAAATAFERSMASETFAKKEKKTPSNALFALEKPDSYEFTFDSISPRDAQEVENYGRPGDAIYVAMRNEVGPALTHRDASNLMYHWKKNFDAQGGAARWSQVLNSTPGSTYEVAREFVLTGKEKIYGDPESQEDLTKNLVEKARKALTAKRNYGYDTAEMERYNMDKTEAEYVEALSVLSGDEPAVVKKKLYALTPIARPEVGLSKETLEHNIDKLERRIPTLKNRNLIAERQGELNGLKREAEIREVIALPKDDAWKAAAESPRISQADALALLSYPNRTDLRNMDGKTRDWWTS